MTRRTDKSIKVAPFYAMQSRTLRNSAKTSEWSFKIGTRRVNIDYMKISQDDKDSLRGIKFHQIIASKTLGKKSLLRFG